eukprot:11210064-Lingulodinium_polyedra.AAC.1
MWPTVAEVAQRRSLSSGALPGSCRNAQRIVARACCIIGGQLRSVARRIQERVIFWRAPFRRRGLWVTAVLAA